MEAGDRPLSMSVKSGLSPTWWVGGAGGWWVVPAVADLPTPHRRGYKAGGKHFSTSATLFPDFAY